MTLPVVPPPVYDERLSSWLARLADIYLVSPADLCTHIGLRGERVRHLDLDVGDTDIERLAGMTGIPANALMQLTYRDAPARLRNLVDPDSRDICPVCTDEAGADRAPRLKDWAFAFTLWCPKHGCRLHGSDMSGLDALGTDRLTRQGVKILSRWAMDGSATTPPMDTAMRLLLMPYRAPSPPAPWELASVSPAMLRRNRKDLNRPYPRKALCCVVPEYDRAVAIHEQRLPKQMLGLRYARAVERHAMAIGIARMIADPVGTAVEILLGCDDFGRSRIEACLSAWPISVREAIVRAYSRRLRPSRRGRARSPVAPALERRRSGIDETTRVESGWDVQLFGDRRPSCVVSIG